MTAMLMEHAIEKDRVVEADYLIGDDPYKKAWMSHRRERRGIIAYNPRSIIGIFGLSREVLSRTLKAIVARVRILMAIQALSPGVCAGSVINAGTSNTRLPSTGCPPVARRVGHGGRAIQILFGEARGNVVEQGGGEASQHR